MVRKGFALNVVLLGMIILFFVIVYHMGSFHIWGPRQITGPRRVIIHQEDYTMKNGLGLAGLYLGTALRYSVYQVMYDNGYRGGFSGIPAENLLGLDALWYDNKDIYPSEDLLLENLEAPALAGLGRYLESDYVFLDSYEVKLPQYTGLDIGKTPEGGIEVNATADKNLWIKRTMQNLDKIELEKNASLEENFGKGYLELYQKSLERLEEIKGRFGEIRTELDEVKSGTLTKEQEGSFPQITEEEVFLETLKNKLEIWEAGSKGEGETTLREMFQGILNELSDQAGETTVDFDIPEVTEETFTVGEFKESEDCTKQETQRKEGDKTLFKTTLTCSFKYSYDFAVNVSVTDNSGKRYPVFNIKKDEIALEPLTLIFTAREKS